MTCRRALFLCVLLFAARPAHAQSAIDPRWTLAPFIGLTGGNKNVPMSTNIGVTIKWMGAGALGIDGDFGWAPGFFDQTGDLTRHSVLTQLGNVLLMPHHGRADRVQPFLSGGVAVFHAKIAVAGTDGEFNRRKLGWNAGGGATFYFGGLGNLGLQSDVRYIRTFTNNDTDALGHNLSQLGFWRVFAALAARF